MKKACTTSLIIDGKINQTFEDLKKMFGYPIAHKVLEIMVSQNFFDRHPNAITDENGIPVLKEVLSDKVILKEIGESRMQESLRKKYPTMKDNRDNFISLVNDAKTFNSDSPLNSKYVAIVEKQNDGTLGISFKKYSKENAKLAQEQFAVLKVNQKLSNLFSPMGISVDGLYKAESDLGRAGVTDFSQVSKIGNDFISLVRIADNMAGVTALSEEFSHLIIGALKNNPIIQRSLNALKSNNDAIMFVLGEEEYNKYKEIYTSEELEDEDVTDMLAEEALGHILRDAFIANESKINRMSPIFGRVKTAVETSVKSCLSQQKMEANDVINEIIKTINDAETAMSQVVQQVLDGTIEITKEQIMNSESQKKLYSIDQQIDKNIEILKKSKDVELKRYKITDDKTSEEVRELILHLDKHSDRQADTVYGLLKYAKEALTTLRGLDAEFSFFDRLDTRTKFKFLRKVKNYIDSYAGFLEDMSEALDYAEKDSESVFDTTYEIDGKEYNMNDIIKDLNLLSKQMTANYLKLATNSFAAFMSDFIGTEIKVPFGKNKGQTIRVENLIKEAESDISFIDRWLMSMANSSDILLQGFNKVVATAKDNARMEFIKFREEINLLREKCDRLGITDFEWAFEKDEDGNKSGNYISARNYAQFDKDYKTLLKNLDEKYGKNPTGDDAKAKIKERNEWLKAHAKTAYGEPEPNSTYSNPAFFNLSAEQKEILNDFLKLKRRMDQLYPSNRTGVLKAIQKRRTSSERFWESATNPKTLIDNIKESIKEDFMEQEDDDKLFGDKSTRGLTDFKGNEYMYLPILYTARLENPNDISTDLIGTLFAYSYCAIEYRHMEKVVDALEVGKNIVTENRKVNKTRGGKTVKERIAALGMNTEVTSTETSSEIDKKLQDFMESQVYQKHLKDAGTFGETLMNKQKTVSTLLRWSSLAQMGFNFLAQTANIANGTAMQNIEAIAGQFFGAKELAKADVAYMSELPKVISESAARDKTSKLGLFSELINLKQDFKQDATRLRTKSLLKRLFGENIAYLGQTAGDHWLYSRTAIAMAMREKVKVNGQEMSLWDALQVSDVKGSSNLKKIDTSNILDMNGNKFDIAKFGRKVAEINHRLFGIYNDEDLSAAHRTMLGRLALQYRKWMVPLYSNRFQSARYNEATGTYHEGFYITVWRTLKEIKRGNLQLGALKEQLTPEEWFNIKRAITEIMQFLAVWGFAALIDWPDDKNRPWSLKMAEYIAKREMHELGSLVPSPILIQEAFKTVKQPIPSLSAVNNLFQLGMSVCWPPDYIDEIQSGPYKGLSTVEKNFIKAPIPGIAQYQQINKFSKEIDNSINYYARPY